MRFTISSTALFSHLQAISRVINSKNSLPILDCFLLELVDGTLHMTASDNETTLSTSIEVNEYEGEGRLAVSSKTLLEALKEIPEQPLNFHIADNLEIPERTVQPDGTECHGVSAGTGTGTECGAGNHSFGYPDVGYQPQHFCYGR